MTPTLRRLAVAIFYTPDRDVDTRETTRRADLAPDAYTFYGTMRTDEAIGTARQGTTQHAHTSRPK